jgi:hypothetical protein
MMERGVACNETVLVHGDLEPRAIRERSRNGERRTKQPQPDLLLDFILCYFPVLDAFAERPEKDILMWMRLMTSRQMKEALRPV